MTVTTFIFAIMITALLAVIGIAAILLGLRFVITKLAEIEICMNIYQAQLKDIYTKLGFNNCKISNEAIVHAFDDYIKREVQEK